MQTRKIFITGAAGFIGFHLARTLLHAGHSVHGYDNLSDYYDVSLKRARLGRLMPDDKFSVTEGCIENRVALEKAVMGFAPDVVIHLAGQAGVRHSLEHPRAYVDTNMVGGFNVLDAAKQAGVAHLMLASTSSIYGANDKTPFAETDRADEPLTIYAASKKAVESLAHANAHLWGVPTTVFRFFTVYGPWGRPDMAYYKFARAITEGRAIDIYNYGKLTRDFTYVDDLVTGIVKLMACVPVIGHTVGQYDSLSPNAPYRVVNIGNAHQVKLMDFIQALEIALGKKAIYNFVEMQKGDVPATWADTSLLSDLTGFTPSIDVAVGLKHFADWFRSYQHSPIC